MAPQCFFFKFPLLQNRMYDWFAVFLFKLQELDFVLPFSTPCEKVHCVTLCSFIKCVVMSVAGRSSEQVKHFTVLKSCHVVESFFNMFIRIREWVIITKVLNHNLWVQMYSCLWTAAMSAFAKLHLLWNLHGIRGSLHKIFSAIRLLLVPKSTLQTGQDGLASAMSLPWHVSHIKCSWRKKNSFFKSSHKQWSEILYWHFRIWRLAGRVWSWSRLDSRRSPPTPASSDVCL